MLHNHIKHPPYIHPIVEYNPTRPSPKRIPRRIDEPQIWDGPWLRTSPHRSLLEGDGLEFWRPFDTQAIAYESELILTTPTYVRLKPDACLLNRILTSYQGKGSVQ